MRGRTRGLAHACGELAAHGPRCPAARLHHDERAVVLLALARVSRVACASGALPRPLVELPLPEVRARRRVGSKVASALAVTDAHVRLGPARRCRPLCGPVRRFRRWVLVYPPGANAEAQTAPQHRTLSESAGVQVWSVPSHACLCARHAVGVVCRCRAREREAPQHDGDDGQTPQRMPTENDFAFS